MKSVLGNVQETNGGALYVDKDSSATFMGAASFIGNSVISTDLPSVPGFNGGIRSVYKPRNGGAVFNKGDLVFEGATDFTKNEAVTTDNTNEGRGGAIYNARIGTITFNGPLTATENNADGFFVGKGGVIFNAGNIIVQGTSSFTENTAADGGAIYVGPTATMTFNDFATFTENSCFETSGGAIYSDGSLNLMGGSLFQSQIASSSGDGGDGGGIYNGEGSLTFGGDNTFDDNWAFRGGAIYNGAESSLTRPQDGGELIFTNTRGEFCPAIYTSGAEPKCSS